MPPKSNGVLMPSPLPPTAALELTYRCNHACLFCSCPWDAPDGSFERLPEQDTQQVKQMIDTLLEMGVSHLSFTGGEPLLRPDIVEILRHSASATATHFRTEDGELRTTQAAPTLHMNTNGRLVDEAFAAVAAECGLQLTVSLPGWRSFEQLTGGGDVQSALNAIKVAKAAGLLVTVAVTVTKLNLSELYQNIAEGLLAGADQLLLNRFMPGGRGLGYREMLSLSKEELHEALLTAEVALADAGRYGSMGTELPACVVDGLELKHLYVASQCSAVQNFVAVDPSGFVRVCNHSPVRLGHYTQCQEFPKHPLWRQHVLREFKPDSCHECSEHLQCDAGCPAVAYILQGSVEGGEPGLVLRQLSRTAPGA